MGGMGDCYGAAVCAPLAHMLSGRSIFLFPVHKGAWDGSWGGSDCRHFSSSGTQGRQQIG